MNTLYLEQSIDENWKLKLKYNSKEIELTNEQEASLWAREAVKVTINDLMYMIEAGEGYNWWYIATPVNE
jgi:hypothetical protein